MRLRSTVGARVVALLVLLIGLSPTAASADPCEEPNGGFGGACFLGTDGGAVGTLDEATDLDGFYFDVPEEGATVHATLSNLSGDAGLDLFGSDGEPLVHAASPGAATEHVIAVLLPGRYYLFVTNATNAAVGYTLTLSLEPTPQAAAGGVAIGDPCPEPNDSPATACFLGTESPAVGSLATARDADLYAVEVPGGGAVLTATLTDLPADFDLFLSDGESILAQSLRGGTNDDRLEMAVEGGRYYLEVRNASSAAHPAEPYTLRVSLAPPPPPDPCPEPNDRPETGCYFGTSFPAVGTMATANDLDVYIFDVPSEGGRVTATLSTLPADFDLYLVSGDGETVLDQSTRTGTDVDRIVTDLPGGQYLLAVVNASGSGYTQSTYTLTLEIGPSTGVSTAPPVGATVAAS
jgi:hypothetical protein